MRREGLRRFGGLQGDFGHGVKGLFVGVGTAFDNSALLSAVDE